jgi:hypothetical protein
MQTARIRISDIVLVTERLRALQPSAVASLAESIREIGLRTPITVRMVNGKPHLVTGEHRVAAMKANREDHIDAVIFDNERDARIWAIDENLQRADLTALERSQHITARAGLIAQRAQAARERGPMPDRRFATRDEAKAAGETFYYPAEQCVNGHDGKRYVSNTTCYECHKAKVAKWQANKGYKLENGLPVYTAGGRGRTGGNRAAAREMGVSHPTVGTAKMIDKLSERAKQEAINLGLANRHHSLRFAAAHDTAELQVKALRSEAKKLIAKQERKRLDKATVAEQVAAAAPPRQIPLIDHRRETTANYWLWLIEEFGERAYLIVNRLREVDIGLLLEVADKAKAEGTTAPKQSLH